jgi:hypothetical protein
MKYYDEQVVEQYGFKLRSVGPKKVLADAGYKDINGDGFVRHQMVQDRTLHNRSFRLDRLDGVNKNNRHNLKAWGSMLRLNSPTTPDIRTNYTAAI